MKVPARPERLPLLGFVFASLLSLSAVVMAADQPTTGAGPSSATQPSPGGALPDISGMAWMMDDLFVVVHDVKHHKSLQQPRVSLLRLPDGTAGIQLRNLAPAWPSAGGAAHDLESIARIPDSRELLLVESGDEGSEFRRIFHGRLNGERLQLVNALTWPLPVRNVEGSAVARVGERLIFLYAERAHDQATTSIRWADLTLDPLRLGRFQQVPFASPETRGPHSRPVSALEVDRQGNLYAASTVDSGDNNGPFRSKVWRIGRITGENEGRPRVILDADPQLLATLDGLKVEALAIREMAGSRPELFIGVDDENYGGTVRSIPLPTTNP